VLILDVPALAVQANVLSGVRETSSAHSDAPLEAAPEQKEALLLVTGPNGARMAIPLLQITRLAEFSSASLESVGNREVVQYFGEILPLTDLAGCHLESGKRNRSLSAPSAERLQALVYSRNGRHVGVVVEQILDTIEESLVNLRPATRPGVTGSLVVDGRVTEILDLDTIFAGLTATPVVTAPQHVLVEVAA
jgi:two-component system chemotaxis sensor kinase CheA